jgi:hypothetical protein
MSSSNGFRDFLLSGDNWVDIAPFYPRLDGAAMIIVREKPAKIFGSNSAEPPTATEAENVMPGEGIIVGGVCIWVKGKGAKLEITKPSLA